MPSMNVQQPHRVAIVTGASRGIGAAIALALAQRGILPVLAVRQPDTAIEAAAAIEKLGMPVHRVTCDVADPASATAAVASCLELAGRLDIVVNNAGQIDPIGKLGGTPPDDWLRAIAVNLVAPYRMVHAAMPALLQSATPVVVNLSSGAAHTPREGWSAYCSAKAGLAMFTRCLALEYPQIASYGVQPGVVDTDMQVRIRASGINEISRIPRGSLVQASEPARFVAWLCDQRPADLAGHDLNAGNAELKARLKDLNS
ncbi:MAG: SDR family NAD(P)-dependent oxidoreductase [Haliea sp.]|nr:MAG: SDR family NAD(P)-dependent oxidoreductase [Haliea sp.]